MPNAEYLIQTMLRDTNNTAQMIVDAITADYDSERLDTLKRLVSNYQKGHASNPSQTPVIIAVQDLLEAM